MRSPHQWTAANASILGLDLLQKLRGELLCIDLTEIFFDVAVGADQSSNAIRFASRGVRRSVVSNADSEISIANEGEGEALVIRELGVLFDRIIGAADDGHLLLLEFREQGLESPPLCGASACAWGASCCTTLGCGQYHNTSQTRSGREIHQPRR
eukprot:scaffold3821_cov134-Isochrysis_galbana.AAC.1